MIKEISQYAQDRFAEYMAQTCPEFKKSRISLAKTACPGGDVYARVVDNSRIAWIVFGGMKSKDKDLYAAVGWTRSGLKLPELTYWEKRLSFDIPESGMLTLVDEELIGDDCGEEGRFIEVAEPSSELKQRALEAFKSSEMGKRISESIRGKLVKKNPSVSEAEIKAALEESDRGQMVFFKLWSEVAPYVQLDQMTLSQVTQPAIEKTCYLLTRYGLPFLDARLR